MSLFLPWFFCRLRGVFCLLCGLWSYAPRPALIPAAPIQQLPEPAQRLLSFHISILSWGETQLTRGSYFSSWFHTFDAAVILASFAIDLVAHGVAEDIASLVVVLRLWRFVKVVEEVSLGAAERMEDLEAQIEKLTEENRVMGLQLARDRSSSRGS